MISFFRRKSPTPDANHPAYALGEQLGRWWLRQERRVADVLNAWQGRVSTGRRNLVLLTLFLASASYFIWLLFQTQ